MNHRISPSRPPYDGDVVMNGRLPSGVVALGAEFDREAYDANDGCSVNLFLGTYFRADLTPAQLPPLLDALTARESIGTNVDGVPESWWSFDQPSRGCVILGRDAVTLEYGHVFRLSLTDLDYLTLALREFSQCLPT